MSGYNKSLQLLLLDDVACLAGEDCQDNPQPGCQLGRVLFRCRSSKERFRCFLSAQGGDMLPICNARGRFL
jgi:hypothetical protein